MMCSVQGGGTLAHTNTMLSSIFWSYTKKNLPFTLWPVIRTRHYFCQDFHARAGAPPFAGPLLTVTHVLILAAALCLTEVLL